MKEYFDTPIIVSACVNAGCLGEYCRKTIAACQEPVSSPHALAESFNALTYRLGLPPKTARELIQRNTKRFVFVTMEADDYRKAIDRVIASGMTGDKVYDSLHFGAAVKANAQRLHTSNKRDFSPFSAEMEIVKPPISKNPPAQTGT